MHHENRALVVALGEVWFSESFQFGSFGFRALRSSARRKPGMSQSLAHCNSLQDIALFSDVTLAIFELVGTLHKLLYEVHKNHKTIENPGSRYLEILSSVWNCSALCFLKLRLRRATRWRNLASFHVRISLAIKAGSLVVRTLTSHLHHGCQC